ncbi:MAG: hypothetical protein GY716_24075 [bacterium]|nr:hypothetical protein [bacterium]
MKRPRNDFPPRSRRRTRTADPLDAGMKIKDSFESRTGVVLDHACQYAHPKADPVYSYLVRWDDGQVSAISEGAFSHGVKVVE